MRIVFFNESATSEQSFTLHRRKFSSVSRKIGVS
jgi:hypothetical protein